MSGLKNSDIKIAEIGHSVRRLQEAVERMDTRLQILEMRDNVYTGELSGLKDDVRHVKTITDSTWKQSSVIAEHIGAVIDMLRSWRKSGSGTDT